MRTLLGVILAVTPAALWIAWSAELVLAVMAVAVVSAALFVCLTESSPQHRKDDMAKLPENFVDEVQRLFPLTYHHSAAGPARFRRTMQRLQELLKPR